MLPADAYAQAARGGCARGLVRRRTYRPASLVLPLFVSADDRSAAHRRSEARSISSASTIPARCDECTAAAALGVAARCCCSASLPQKDEYGSGAYDAEGVVQTAVRALKEAAPGAARDDRRLPVRVHRPRPLRHAARGRQIDNDATSSCSRERRCRHARRAPTSSRRRT